MSDYTPKPRSQYVRELQKQMNSKPPSDPTAALVERATLDAPAALGERAE